MHATDTIPWDDDKPHEECGVFGVWGAADASALVALGLHALQHRGQEAAGIVTLDRRTPDRPGQFHAHKGRGLVGDNFSDARVIAALPGRAALGHNRYATTGETALRNVQPLYADFEFGGLAVAHNGNLTNALQLKRALVRRGCLFQSTTDSEVFVHLIAISLYSTVTDRLIDALKQVQGAYSLVALHEGALIGARDPLGVRPLVIGRLGGAHVLASETCALDIVGAEFLRDVEPGEIVIIDDAGLRSIKPFGGAGSRFCIFEYIYFARPDSSVEEPRSTRRASASAPSWRGKARYRPTWSCRCRIPACPPRWATPRRRGCPSSSASSATTMSDAPSSSRRTRSATSA